MTRDSDMNGKYKLDQRFDHLFYGPVTTSAFLRGR